jgi:very-short-patch-repair endonuclease
MLVPLDLVSRHNAGVFTRAQALACGLAPGEVRALVETGIWTKLRHGVYVDHARLASATPQERAVIDIAAARATIGIPTVGSETSAAVAYGVPLLADPRAVTLTADRALTRGAPGQPIIVRQAHLPADHLVALDGVLMTDPARTAVDLSRCVPMRDAVVALDAMLHSGLVSMDDIVRVAEHAHLLAPLMQVLGHVDARSESTLESVSRLALLAQGLERPELQYEIRDEHGVLIARVDFFWSRFGVAGEADGLAKYDNDPSALRREKLRQEALERMGIRVVRWTWREITTDPAAVAERIRRAIRMRVA